jgi:predicted GNAT family acetyltransferase
MAYRSSGVVGIYGVTTLDPARGRGFATAMTRAALATAPGRPAVLQPTPAAGGIYARLGFTTVGPYAHWV